MKLGKKGKDTRTKEKSKVKHTVSSQEECNDDDGLHTFDSDISLGSSDTEGSVLEFGEEEQDSDHMSIAYSSSEEESVEIITMERIEDWSSNTSRSTFEKVLGLWNSYCCKASVDVASDKIEEAFFELVFRLASLQKCSSGSIQKEFLSTLVTILDSAPVSSWRLLYILGEYDTVPLLDIMPVLRRFPAVFRTVIQALVSRWAGISSDSGENCIERASILSFQLLDVFASTTKQLGQHVARKAFVGFVQSVASISYAQERIETLMEQLLALFSRCSDVYSLSFKGLRKLALTVKTQSKSWGFVYSLRFWMHLVSTRCPMLVYPFLQISAAAIGSADSILFFPHSLLIIDTVLPVSVSTNLSVPPFVFQKLFKILSLCVSGSRKSTIPVSIVWGSILSVSSEEAVSKSYVDNVFRRSVFVLTGAITCTAQRPYFPEAYVSISPRIRALIKRSKCIWKSKMLAGLCKALLSHSMLIRTMRAERNMSLVSSEHNLFRSKKDLFKSPLWIYYEDLKNQENMRSGTHDSRSKV